MGKASEQCDTNGEDDEKEQHQVARGMELDELDAG
jgi:hypothetical protein